MTRSLSLAIFLALGALEMVHAAEKGSLVYESLPLASYTIGGAVGSRVKANTEHWLLTAPLANPGMLEMFHVRDRQPAPKLVPWAGEFVGKYLISAVQALRLHNQPQLRARVNATVRELISTQAKDGYLGPFPKAERLKGNWDLWGHYHCMQALLLWHEMTGEPEPLAACRRAADLVCATFLETGLRVADAGSPEMNMAILHVLGQLHRLTRDARYLQMMREIEKDWESAGDYLRTGLAGIDFFKTPKPRWESLHDLQGLVELYRITGDARYHKAFVHHWESIRRWDRRNTGGFSSGEQATGNPYAPTPIETCCTVAWMALSIDMLQLTGQSVAADELELSLFNAGAGSQHPSGRWWTYNTPMDGAREASAHSIVFQARAGTPELNCCSVNGPRCLGSLSEWAVLRSTNGMVINYYGPYSFQGKLQDNTPFAFEMSTAYPAANRVDIRLEPLSARRFSLRLRIPAWSEKTQARVNGQVVATQAGQYLEINRLWKAADRVQLEFDFGLRAVRGEKEAAGLISLYRGPILLAYDQRHNSFDETEVPALHLGRLLEAREIRETSTREADIFHPWVMIDVLAQGDQAVRLVDFASAGNMGTRYRTWLNAME